MVALSSLRQPVQCKVFAEAVLGTCRWFVIGSYWVIGLTYILTLATFVSSLFFMLLTFVGF